MEQILPRQSISDDARRAAERCIASGADQPNLHAPDTDAFAQWAADYRRWLHTLQAGEDTEASA